MYGKSNPRAVVVSMRAEATDSRQESLVLRPYVDFLMNDEIEDLYNLARHAGIQIGGGNLADTVLSHYRLADDRYDVGRALDDFASRPPLQEIKRRPIIAQRSPEVTTTIRFSRERT